MKPDSVERGHRGCGGSPRIEKENISENPQSPRRSRPIETDSRSPGGMSSYAGRWVARLRGQIVGQGGTPEQALQAAKASRHKETPEVVFAPMTTPLALPPLLAPVR